jgi:hypothetical protein
MTVTQLVLNGTSFPFAKRKLVATCDLFDRQTSLADSPYPVKSRVSTASLELFLLALDKQPIEISSSNHDDLVALCREFGFDGLAADLSAFEAAHPSASTAGITELEELCFSLERRAQALENQVADLRAECASLRSAQTEAARSPASLPPAEPVDPARWGTSVMLRLHLAALRPLSPGIFDPTAFSSSFLIDRDKIEPLGRVGETLRGRYQGTEVCLQDCFGGSASGDAARARMVAWPLMRNLATVVQPLGFCLGEFALVTRFYPHGNLYEALRRYHRGDPPPGFGATQLSKCAIGVALTMLQYTARGAVHTDLRPTNVFLDSHFEPLLFDGTTDQFFAESEALTVTPPFRMDGYSHLAPEVASASDDWPKEASDAYSFGVLVARLLVGDLSLTDGTLAGHLGAVLLLSHIRKGERFALPPHVPDRLRELIQACWEPCPGSRPSFVQIVETLLGSDDWLFPGTDLRSYRDYCDRRLAERPGEARPASLIDSVAALLAASQR